MWYKKVLLRERKRHTARRVVSTPSVVLTGYPPPPILTGPGGTLPGYPHSGQGGAPPSRVSPILTWQGTPLGRVPPWQGTPILTRQGTPLAGPGWVPPPSRCLPHGILGNVAKHYGIWVLPPCGQTDRWMDGQTRVKTLPSRRTTYAGGNNYHVMANQNVPITSIFTDFTLGSWEDFDVGLTLIGSKEIMWITFFAKFTFERKRNQTTNLNCSSRVKYNHFLYRLKKQSWPSCPN